jgi:hypothetical protein
VAQAASPVNHTKTRGSPPNLPTTGMGYEAAKEIMAAVKLRVDEQTTSLRPVSIGTQTSKSTPGNKFRGNPIPRLDVDAVLARSLPREVSRQAREEDALLAP